MIPSAPKGCGLSSGRLRGGEVLRRPRRRIGPHRDVEFRRIREVPLDRALADGALQGLPVSLGEGRRWHDFDPDTGDPLAARVPDGLERQGQPLRVEVSLLAEPQGVEAGAGPDRTEEEVEGRRGLARASLRERLVGQDPEPLVQGLDSKASRKGNLHVEEDTRPDGRTA